MCKVCFNLNFLSMRLILAHCGNSPFEFRPTAAAAACFYFCQRDPQKKEKFKEGCLLATRSNRSSYSSLFLCLDSANICCPFSSGLLFQSFSLLLLAVDCSFWCHEMTKTRRRLTHWRQHRVRVSNSIAKRVLQNYENPFKRFQKLSHSYTYKH